MARQVSVGGIHGHVGCGIKRFFHPQARPPFLRPAVLPGRVPAVRFLVVSSVGVGNFFNVLTLQNPSRLVRPAQRHVAQRKVRAVNRVVQAVVAHSCEIRRSQFHRGVIVHVDQVLQMKQVGKSSGGGRIEIQRMIRRARSVIGHRGVSSRGQFAIPGQGRHPGRFHSRVLETFLANRVRHNDRRLNEGEGVGVQGSVLSKESPKLAHLKLQAGDAVRDGVSFLRHALTGVEGKVARQSPQRVHRGDHADLGFLKGRSGGAR